MADKDKVKEFMELRMFKEEYVAKLEAIGIEDVDALAEALASEERVEEIHEHLKGVGPKTIEHWREDLGVEVGADEEEPEEEAGEEPAPRPKARKVKAKADEEVAEEKEEEPEVEIEDEEEGYRVKLKPKLSKATLDALAKRSEVDGRRPEFLRQEWYKRKRLQGAKWRKPRGMHSKMRQHYGYRRNVVSIGYGSPKGARFLHPSGFKEVMVHNVKDLQKINPETEAARVAHKVGMKKRLEIEAKADELKVRVLNRSG
ncbi:MAG: 50S ribosomal protein L32e [Candidatus Thermoplasmatota archaeon]